MRRSRLHHVFGADDLQPSAGDLVVMQPTSADPWYDSKWSYIGPYHVLVYGTVMKPGEAMIQQFDQTTVKKGARIPIKTVPSNEGGVAWYPVLWDEKTSGKYNQGVNDDGSPRQDFPYWPSVWRASNSIVKVLPKPFRVFADEIKTPITNEDAKREIQAMLDALTSILTPRVSTIVTAATKAKPLDEDESDRARAAVARTLAKAVFSLWFERLNASRSANLNEVADTGVLLFTDQDTATSTTKQDGAWDTLGQLRAFADLLTTEAGLPDFDKPDDAGGNGFSRALAKIARDPSSPDSLTGGTTPADLLNELFKTNIVGLDKAFLANVAVRAAAMWTVKRSAPVAPAPSPATPAAPSVAPSIVPAAAAAQPEQETTAPTPQRGGMGAKDAGAPSWLLPVAAGVLGLAVVSALVRRD
jgi:hypothetical protein